MSDEEEDIAACICRHSAGVVGGIAPGPQPGQVLVTVQNDGILCYDTATKVSWRRVPECICAGLPSIPHVYCDKVPLLKLAIGTMQKTHLRRGRSASRALVRRTMSCPLNPSPSQSGDHPDI